MAFAKGTSLVVLFLSPAVGAAAAVDSVEINLEEALQLARAQAPEARAARMRVDEARGRVVSASVLMRDNPRFGVSMGTWLGGPRALAVDAELSQTIELGDRRRARIAGAEAGVDRAAAYGDAVTRGILRDVGLRFYRALHAQARVALATRAEELAQSTLAIAERRYRAGDVPRLHASLAVASLARARSERRAAEAAVAGARGDLAAVLGMDAATSPVAVGDLLDHGHFDRAAALVSGWPLRPELRLRDAEAQEAAGDRRLGQGLRWPELTLGVRYTQDEPGAHAALANVALTLPTFERGQGLRAEARAREDRARFELDVTRRRLGVEAATALAVYRKQVEALGELESTVPTQEENEAVARRSYEVGQLGLAELLLVRREVLETRAEYLARQLDVALAGIELGYSSGALR